MKNINLKTKKYLAIFAMIISLNLFSMQALALDPIENALTAGQWVSDKITYVTGKINQVKQVISSAKSAATLVKNLKNFDMSMFASKLSGVAMKQIGDTVTQSISIKRDSYTNPLTNGAQVVTDLKGFIKSNGENAIRNVLTEQSIQSGTNPYISTSLKNVVKRVRADANDQITIQLPFIAQKEICNNDKLKNIIKNGEPKTYINPKPAVKNVDITRLCNTDLSSETEGKAAQVTFIGLAKAGYGSSQTNVALADPANTPNGVSAALEAKINKEYNESITNATNQYTSNGGIIGSQICLDKDGKSKKFDATDPNKAYCDNLVTSASSSAAVVKANLDAARLSPYLDILAKAQATKGGDCGKGAATSYNYKNALSTILSLFSFSVDKVLAAGDIQHIDVSSGSGSGSSNSSSGSSGGSQLDKASKVACELQGDLDKMNSFLNIANDIIGAPGSGSGGTPDFTTNNTYAQLATSLDGVVGTEQGASGLGDAASQANKDYALGLNATVTAERIPQVIDLYKQARKINTEKLNEEVYTYGMLRAVLAFTGNMTDDYKNQFINRTTKSAVLNVFSGGISGIFGGRKKDKKAFMNMMAAKSAANGMNKAYTNLGKDIRSLISQMAYNNYKEQQLTKLQDLFEKTDARPEDNMESIMKALDNTITDEQVGQIDIDWSYITRFISTNTNPSIDDTNLLLAIPQSAEMVAPFTKNNLENLRLRAYNMAKLNGFSLSGVIASFNLTPMLKGFGFNSILGLKPEMPRISYPFQIVDKDTVTYSEKSYCDKIGVGICDTKNLSIVNIINNDVYQLQNDPVLKAVDKSVQDICANPETEVQNYCTSSDGANDNYCKSTASTTELIQQFVDNNCDNN